MKSVFEVIDQTNEEMFYPLGIFPTLKEAKEAVLNIKKDERISFYSEDYYEKIEIKEREMGWTEEGKTVFILECEEVYDEKDDEFYWERKELL